MPRLPDKSALGPAPSLYTPERIITGPQYGAGLVGQGLEKLGGSLESASGELLQNQNHLQTMQAEADRVVRTQELDQKFQQDNDYATFAPRAQASLQEINTNASSLISDPQAKALFQARATAEGQRVYHEILARGTNLARQNAVDTLEDSAGKIALGIRSAATPEEAARRTDELEQAVRTFNPGLVDPNHQRRIIDKYIRGQGGIIGRIADERAYDIAGKGFNAQWDNLKELEAAPSRGAPQLGLGEAPNIQDLNNSPVWSSPRQGPITGIVTHHTSGDTLEGALDEARKRDAQGRGTGANYYVDRDGTIYQGAPDSRSTVHIREPGSRYRNGNNPDLGNGNTVGIEYVGKNAKDITPDQLAAGQKLISWIAKQNSVKPDNVVGHGEIQGGPRGNKEEDEGVAAAKGYRDAANAPPQTPTKVAANDNATGVAEPMRWADIYARMDPATLSRKITNARNALHQSVLTEADGAEKVAETTGQIPKDNDGQTVLDHSRVLLPNQQTKVKYKVEGGLNRYNAVAPLSDMTDDEARQHIYQTLDPSKAKMSDGQPLPYAIAAKNQAYADKLYAKIKKQRDDDPAQAAMGAPLSVGGTPRVSAVDDKGQPTVTDGNDDGDVATNASREVAEALRQIHGKPGDINDPNTDRLAKIQARSRLFDARLATQQRWGIPQEDQRIVTKEEAQKIFGTRHLSRIPGDDQRFLDLDQKARERAYEWYGSYGGQAYRDAAKLLMSQGQQKSAAIDLATGLLSGKLSPEDLWVDRTRRYGAPETSPRFAPPQQVMPPPPASRGRPGMPPVRSGATSAESSPAQPPGPEFPTPNPGHLTWLQKHADDREALRFFDSKFGRGAAQREIAKMQGQPQ